MISRGPVPTGVDPIAVITKYVYAAAGQTERAGLAERADDDRAGSTAAVGLIARDHVSGAGGLAVFA
jgi:hypothetical protein